MKNNKVIISLIFSIILLSVMAFFGYKFLSKIEIPDIEVSLEYPQFPNNECNIIDYGAIGDGKNVNTLAIKTAIESCYEKGGGKVVFPAGKWLTGSIHLKSNINLELKKNSELIFTTNLDDYLPVVFSRFQGMEYYGFSPPIYAKDCENIALTGEGKIIGNGEFWEEWSKTPNNKIESLRLFEMSENNLPVVERIFDQKNSGLRPSFIQFINSKKIYMDGLEIENGPMWTIHPVYSEDIWIKNIKISTHSANTDGIVIDSSRNVIIEKSEFSTGDDSIAIKSGLETEGLRISRLSENIIIKNSNFYSGHGAVVIGSEMSGGVRNILIKDIMINGNNTGFRIKSTESRGGFIENIFLNNIDIKNVKEVAINFNLKYNSTFKNPKISRKLKIKNIYFNHINGKSADKAVSIKGLQDARMENINFTNFYIESERGIEIEDAKNIKFMEFILNSEVFDPAVEFKDVSNINYSGLKCGINKEPCLIKEERD